MNGISALVYDFAKKIFLVILCVSISNWLGVAGFAQSSTDPTSSDQYVRLKFVDNKGVPISGVKISPAFFTESTKDAAFAIAQHRSNEEGILSLTVNEMKGIFSVWTQKRGYAPVQTEINNIEEKTISLDLAPLYKGIVVDTTGKPVPNAMVFGYQEFDDFRDPGEPFLADENGLFSVPWKTDKANFLATDGQGNYAQLINAAFEDNRLQLRPSTSLEVVLEDNRGNRLPNGLVEIRSWNGCGCIKFSAKSNEDGVVTFQDIPVGKLAVYAMHDGFRPLWLHVDSGQVKRLQIAMKRPQTFKIRALDAETNQSIPQFKVNGYFSTELNVSETGPTVPSQLQKKWGWGLLGEQGIATMNVERFYDKVNLKVFAHGYHFTGVTVVDSDEESIDVVAKLQRQAQGQEKIKVLAINGTPAKDACVLLQSEGTSSRVDIHKTREDELFNEQKSRIRFTNDDGFASFDTIPFEGFVIAWNQDGYFQGSFADTDVTAPIQLEPFATLRLRLPRFLHSNPLNELESSLPSKIPTRVNTGLRPSWIAYQLFILGENPERLHGIDENGQIEMKVLPGAPAQIHFTYFQSKGVRTLQPLIEYQASPGDEIDIDLTGDSSIRGKIRFDWETMQPKQLIAPLIYASTKNSNGTVLYQAVVKNDGSFEFTQIPSGEYRLTMSMIAAEDDQAIAPQRRRITVSPQFTKSLTLGKTENCDLDELDVRLEASPLNRR